MKLKHLFYLLGFKPKPKEYSYIVEDIPLAEGRVISFARWQHPKERKKHITQNNIDALGQFLQPGDAAIDIGAHTGDSTLPIALAVGAEGAVFAVEPNPYVFKILKVNAELNPTSTHIIPLRVAATEKEEELCFHYSDEGFCNGGYFKDVNPLEHGHLFELKVQGVNLHRLIQKRYAELLPKIRYIKTDTEGYDYQVIQTLKDLIQHNKPVLRSEIHKTNSDEYRRRFVDLFHELGYELFKLDNEESLERHRMDRDEMMNGKTFDILAFPRAESK